PKFDWAEAQRENGGSATAEKTDEVSEASEERLHESGCENARRDEFAAGGGAHSAHGVNLFRDQHGTKFGGNTGSATACYEDSAERGAEFANESNGDNVTGESGLAETRELRTGLQNHDDADEKSGEKNDGERADA